MKAGFKPGFQIPVPDKSLTDRAMTVKSIDVPEVLTRQKEFFLRNNTLSTATRKENLKKLARVLKENEERIAAAVYRDFGKSWFEVLENELGLVYAEIRKARKNLNSWARAGRVPTSLSNLPGRSRIYQLPFGCVLVIAPWNYPVQLSLIPLVSAIAAGNTVILKPSELTSETSSVLRELLNKTFPPELIFVKEGGINETTELLKLKFDKIFFTGSTEVGKIVMAAAAKHLTPVTLELGGKNPVIVLPDCKLKMTAKRLVWGKFHNGGQACVSPDHIYVHKDIEKELLSEVQANILEMFRGDPKNSEAFPRIINTAHYDRLMNMIKPDKVLMGGAGDRDSLYIEPTVMAGVNPDDEVMKEEVFGPLMPFISFSDLDNLLDEIKKQPLPLSLYVFTKNLGLARKIHREVRSGGGMINDTVVHFVNGTPFGGVGESGMGAYHGRSGFNCFSHQKAVLSKPYWFELPVKYPPYTKWKLKVIKAILR